MNFMLLNEKVYILFYYQNHIFQLLKLICLEYRKIQLGYVQHSLFEKFRDERNFFKICNSNVQDYIKNYKVSDYKFQIRLTNRTTIACLEQHFLKYPLKIFYFEIMKKIVH